MRIDSVLRIVSNNQLLAMLQPILDIVRVGMCAYACVCTCICTCTHACVSVCLCVRVHLYACVCGCGCVCVCACVRVYVHAHLRARVIRPDSPTGSLDRPPKRKGPFQVRSEPDARGLV